MSWSKKINNKKYALGTAITVVFGVFMGWPSFIAIFWLIFVIMASIINHYSTIMIFSRLIESRITDDAKVNKAKMAFHLLLKSISLIGAFVCLVNFSRNMVLQGMALYIFQLIILCLSIKNIGQFLKKGTSE